MPAFNILRLQDARGTAGITYLLISVLTCQKEPFSPLMHLYNWKQDRAWGSYSSLWWHVLCCYKSSKQKKQQHIPKFLCTSFVFHHKGLCYVLQPENDLNCNITLNACVLLLTLHCTFVVAGLMVCDSEWLSGGDAPRWPDGNPVHGQQLWCVPHHGERVHEGGDEDQGGWLPGESNNTTKKKKRRRMSLIPAQTILTVCNDLFTVEVMWLCPFIKHKNNRGD